MRLIPTIVALLTTLLCAATPVDAAVSPGSPAPAFTLVARDGGKVSLADLAGQVVMINFWATWCGPCRQEMPLLAQLHDKYEPLGFTMIGVNVEPDSAAAVTWLKGVPVTFPILFDTDSAVAGRFGVEGMPSSVLVDRNGQVRYIHRGYKPGDEAKYADMIRSLLKE
jgi:peroxiredoxin